MVASADYRLGWNPLATNPIEGTIGIINAAYRGVQNRTHAYDILRSHLLKMVILIRLILAGLFYLVMIQEAIFLFMLVR